MASQADQPELSSILAELQDLKARVASLESTQDTQAENQLIQLRLINSLRKEPQPLQRDRGEILRALLAANGGKMLAGDARKKMHLSDSRFSELLSKMDEYIEKKPYHIDRTQNIIILR